MATPLTPGISRQGTSSLSCGQIKKTYPQEPNTKQSHYRVANLPFILFRLFFNSFVYTINLLLLSNENTLTFDEKKFVSRVKTNLVKTLELNYYHFISMKNWKNYKVLGL